MSQNELSWLGLHVPTISWWQRPPDVLRRRRTLF